MTNLKNWMSGIVDSASVTDISIPGSHESCAMHPGASLGFAQCQEKDIGWQLNHGIRYLDIRCRAIEGSFAIHHGPFYQEKMFGDVLEICNGFLKENPSETILMRIQQEYSEVSGEDFQAIFRDYLDKRGWGSLFYVSNSFPKLGSARGKVILMSGWPYLGSGIRFSDSTQVDIQDDYKDPTVKKKKDEIKGHLARALAADPKIKLFVNHTSANGAGSSTWTPWSFAKDMNPYVLDLLGDKGIFTPGKTTGVIAMDYVNRPAGNDTGDSDNLMEGVIRCNSFKN
ncbi:phosphatidylinositol-specific phospholipase C [Streptomyces albireticuli]|uniref:1-phosphatidylinositol phosphodiesterase n=1 Tax=Streptomyces albireticuli TaxID=1940 RepID=A0A2A2D3D0_9ACTN|nr:phosphatidylinositol-specific phospholipase C [Streptomyces albireticuli]MCD9146031.1 phosphatidylinositol-specific phospholipase C [Streptomyces albireticuli]MCD9166250.1 phosphatidylinositol-specific phospholipase C [Streptomyces albireticuli]MCD9196572.1 phosphatidylinositol-specific phospholipase C [Streptomyces albireticuli]PAU46943.1 phospholipase [Streptomyces albireticuli]